MNLAELQRRFGQFLVSGEAGAWANCIAAGDFDVTERLSIYRNNFLLSLVTALCANFPVTTKMVGENFMRQVAAAFVLAHPPTAPRLAEYGAQFPGFLAATASLSEHRYVPEMAEFEWRRVAISDRPVERALDAATLAAIDPDTLARRPIRMVGHATLLEHQYPLEALWRAHQREPLDLSEIDMMPRARVTLIWRLDHQVLAKEFDTLDTGFLLRLDRPRPLGEAIIEAFGDNENRAQRLLALLLANKLLA